MAHLSLSWLRLVLLVAATVYCGVNGSEWTGPIKNKMVVNGRNATLECRCTNAVVQKPQVVWRHENTLLINRGSATFIDPRLSMVENSARVFDMTIRTVKKSDSGVYHCAVFDLSDKNPRPQRCNQTSNLTIFVRPQALVALSANVTVKEKEAVSLRCSAIGGYPAPKQIQWYYIDDQSSIALPSTNQTAHPDGSLESTLVITPPSQDELRGVYKRTYRCTLEQTDLVELLENDETSGGFYLQQNINVVFHYSSKIVGKIMPQKAKLEEGLFENETVTFRCSGSTAYPADYAWFWSLNGRAVESTREIGERFSTYTLTLSREHHNRVLSCTVCVSSGCDSKNYTIQVKYSPKVTIFPKREVVELGHQTVRFACSVDSNPAAVITWYNEAGFLVRKGSGDLQLNLIRKEDFGIYTCLAEVNTDGLEWSDRAEVVLLEKAPPKIEALHREQSAVTSSSVRVVCEVESAIETSITWLKDGVKVPNNKENSRFATAKETRQDRTVYTLIISNLAKQDFGEYNCTIRNEKGIVSGTVLLKQSDEAPLIAIVIAALAVFFTLLILTISIIACKRSKIKKTTIYRPNKRGAAMARQAQQLQAGNKLRPNVMVVQKENGRTISASSLQVDPPSERKALCEDYFPPFIELDRGAYVRYEVGSEGEMNNNSSKIQDYNTVMTLDRRCGTWTPNGSCGPSYNSCSLLCNGFNGNGSAIGNGNGNGNGLCKPQLNGAAGNEMLAIMPRPFHHDQSHVRYSTEAEEFVCKEDGGSSHDSGFANSQTIGNGGVGAHLMASSGPLGPSRIANHELVAKALPNGQKQFSPINENMIKTSVAFTTMPVATNV